LEGEDIGDIGIEIVYIVIFENKNMGEKKPAT